MIILSVIVPIYKVEEYIVECIESICNQLISGVEIFWLMMVHLIHLWL